MAGRYDYPKYRADFSQDYGVLKYAINELQQNSTTGISALQDTLGGIVHDVYMGVHRGYQQRGGQLSADAYFGSDPSAHQQALNQPVDISLYANTPISNGQTLGDLVPAVRSMSTVRDVQNWLTATMTPGIMAGAAQASKQNGQDFMETVQAGFTNYLESAWNYQRKPNGPQGKSVPYMVYGIQRGFAGSMNSIRSERAYNELRGKSFEGLTGGSHGENGAIEEGVFADVNTVNASAIMPLGGFPERPVALPQSMWGQGGSPIHESRQARLKVLSTDQFGVPVSPNAAVGSPAWMSDIVAGTPMADLYGKSQQYVMDVADAAEAGQRMTLDVMSSTVDIAGRYVPGTPASRPGGTFIDAIASRFTQGLPKEGVPLDIYSRNGRIFDDNGNLMSVGRRGMGRRNQVRLYPGDIPQLNQALGQYNEAQAAGTEMPFDPGDFSAVRRSLNTLGSNLRGGNVFVEPQRTVEMFSAEMDSRRRMVARTVGMTGKFDKDKMFVLESVYTADQYGRRVTTPGKTRSRLLADMPERRRRALYAQLSGVRNPADRDAMIDAALEERSYLMDTTYGLQDFQPYERIESIGEGSGMGMLDVPGASDPEGILDMAFPESEGENDGPIAMSADQSYGWVSRFYNHNSRRYDYKQLDNFLERHPQFDPRLAYTRVSDMLAQREQRDGPEMSDSAETYASESNYYSALGAIEENTPEARYAARGASRGFEMPVTSSMTPFEQNLSRQVYSALTWSQDQEQWHNNPRYRRAALQRSLAAIQKTDPNNAARIQYVGKDRRGFASALRSMTEELGVSLPYKPGAEAKFAEDFAQLQKDNPEASSRISSLFPSEAEQENRVRRYQAAHAGDVPEPEAPSMLEGTPARTFGVGFDKWIKNNPKGTPAEYLKMLAYQVGKGMILSSDVQASARQLATNNSHDAQIVNAVSGVLSGAGNSPTTENTAAPARAPETGHNIRGAQARRAPGRGNPLNPYDADVVPTDPFAHNTTLPARRADPVGGGFKAGDRVIVNGQELTVRENYGGHMRVSGPDGDTWVDQRQARPVPIVSDAGNSSVPDEPEMPDTVLDQNGREIPAASGGGGQPPSGGGTPPAPPDEPPSSGRENTPDPASKRRRASAARNVAEGSRIMREYNNRPASWRDRLAQRAAHPRAYPGVRRDDIGARVAEGFVHPESIDRWTDDVYGTFVKGRDENGEAVYGMTGGLYEMGNEEVQRAQGWAQEAMSNSTRGPLPSDAGMAAGTMRQRIYKSLEESVAKEVERLIASGMSQPEAKAAAHAVKAISEKMLEAGQVVAEHELELEASSRGKSTSRYTGSAAKRNAVYVSGQGVIDLAERSPKVAAQLEEMHLTPEQASQLGQSEAVMVQDENGIYSLSAGYGNSKSGSGLGRNLWSNAGKFGQALYGAYLVNREWKMLVGDQQAQANVYTRSAAGFAPMLTYGGGNVISSDAGAAIRQEIAANFQGRIAQQMFGGFNDPAFAAAMNGNESAGRLITGARTAGGLAAGTAMSIGTLGMIFPAAGITAGSAMIGGLAVGGLAALAFGGMEIYNAAVNPAVPATPGSIFSGTALNWRLAQDRNKYVGGKMAEYDKLTGYSPITTADKQEARDYYKSRVEAQAAKNDYMYQKGYISESDYRELEEWGGKIDPLDAMYSMADQMAPYGVDTADAQKSLALMMRSKGRKPREAEAIELARNASSLGLGASDLASRAAQYASAYGIMGSQGFAGAFDRYFNNATSEPALAGMDYTSAKINQLGSQLQAYMPATEQYADVGNSMVRQYNLTPGQTMGASSLLQAVQSTGGVVTPAQSYMIAGLAQTTNPTLLGKLSNLASDAGNYFGVDVAGLTEMLAKGGMNQDQANLALKIAGGDIKAMSWATYQNPDNATTGSALRTFDQSGNAIWETNGLQATQWASGQAANQLAAGINSPLLQRLARASGPRGVLQAMGAKSERFMNAFLNGVNGVTGYRGVQLQMNQDQYDAQMASIGAAAAGVRLQQQFYWGSGSWDAPAEGSYWNLEDRMIALKDTSARADMEDSRRRMEMSNRYSIKREDNQWARMQTSYNYNEWQSSFNYAQQLQQRTWTQADWQYQDQTRALQFGWSMSDLDEQIRYSSGRQRRSLIRQRDRATISQNMEDMQIERGRDRQEETWKKEDERFTKQVEYQNTLKRLDTESFELNRKQRQETYQMDRDQWSRKKKEYEEQKSIEDEMRKLQRKFQADQLALQLAQIGAQAEQAKRQKEMNDDIARTQEGWGDLLGAFQNISNYTQSRDVLNALGYALSTANNAKYDNIMGFQAIFSKMNELDYMKLRMIRDIFSEMQ